MSQNISSTLQAAMCTKSSETTAMGQCQTSTALSMSDLIDDHYEYQDEDAPYSKAEIAKKYWEIILLPENVYKSGGM